MSLLSTCHTDQIQSIISIISTIAGLVPVILYAEMHYRLPFFKGWLYKKEPEILFDLPYRVQSDILPVLFLVKDADRFPIQIRKIEIILKSTEDDSLLQHITIAESADITEKWFSRIIPVDVRNYKNEHLKVDCFALAQIGDRTTTIRNDNYKTLSGDPFSTFIDAEPLPSEKDWVWGDLHCHSSYTEDQVEFGVPPLHIRPMATAMGLSYCALTEHSYDMDNFHHSWIKNDPNLKKWNDFQQSIRQLNRSSDVFIILPGEEVSVDNGFGRTVHMSVINDPNFHYGSGDGMESSLGKETEHHYATLLENLSPDALAIAAHPMSKPSFLHRLLIHRGTWNHWDIHPKLHGYQILNGLDDDAFRSGKQYWIQKLLKGQHQLIYAGNDSHGNFNRFRQLNIPMLSMHEHRQQIFGYYLTGVKSSSRRGVNGLVQDLKQNPVILTNGPFLQFHIKDTSGDKAEISDTLTGKPQLLRLDAKSSNFFGALKQIQIYLGNIASGKETLYKSITPIAGQYRTSLTLALETLPDRGYLRAEIFTSEHKFALTNPIWFRS
jgi:hypothetical protein